MTWSANRIPLIGLYLEGQVRDADELVGYMRSYERIGAFGGERLELQYYGLILLSYLYIQHTMHR